jgi:hypothetical protein
MGGSAESYLFYTDSQYINRLGQDQEAGQQSRHRHDSSQQGDQGKPAPS